MREGNLEMKEKVRSGEIKIGTAKRMLEKEVMKKMDELDGMYGFLANYSPVEGCEYENEIVCYLLAGLSRAMEALAEKMEECVI
jgi:hypothetical protein